MVNDRTAADEVKRLADEAKIQLGLAMEAADAHGKDSRFTHPKRIDAEAAIDALASAAAPAGEAVALPFQTLGPVRVDAETGKVSYSIGAAPQPTPDVLAMREALQTAEPFLRVLGLDSTPAASVAQQCRDALAALPDPRAGEPGKWRKRPVVIDAFCLGADAMPDWFCDARSTSAVTTHNEDGRYRGGPDYVLIKTLEGEMRANNGDWIIRGVKGELYPCKPDIFAATYEPAASPIATPKPQEGRDHG